MALNGLYVDLSQAQMMEAPPAAMADAELESATGTLLRQLRAIHARLNILEYERGKRQRLQACADMQQPVLL